MRLPSASICVDSVTEFALYGLSFTTPPITLPSPPMTSTCPPNGITAAPFATKNTVSFCGVGVGSRLRRQRRGSAHDDAIAPAASTYFKLDHLRSPISFETVDTNSVSALLKRIPLASPSSPTRRSASIVASGGAE